MTHLSNYGNDRLALYTFKHVVEFVQKYTHLRLKSVSPAQLGALYFDMYPQEKDAVWRVSVTSWLEWQTCVTSWLECQTCVTAA